MNDMDDFSERVGTNVVGCDYPEPEVSSEYCTSSPVTPTPSHGARNTKMWATSDNNFFPCESTVNTLPAGQYLIRNSERGIFFSKKEINLDDLIALPDNNSDKVLDSIAYFWRQEEKFRKFGFLWKRGIMLWGPPGSGKTSTVQQLATQIVEQGGISVYCEDPGVDAEGLRIMRSIEPKRPIVVILEDIDAIINRYSESTLLALLDGELQIDNVVFVATTNYPERLDKRFINRPSRFDEVHHIGMPSAICREVYLQQKNPELSAEQLEYWVDNTAEFSIAHLRELIVSVECLGKDVDESIARLRKMNDIKIASDQNSAFMGFVKTQVE